jgi:predicted nucleotidyltransferase
MIKEGRLSEMAVDKHVIQQIVLEILKVAHPERVILFGSAATGTMSSDSDVDLLVIEKHVSNPREQTLKIRNALRSFRMPVDVIVMAYERFEETKNVVGGIAYPANKYGKVIYEAA